MKTVGFIVVGDRTSHGGIVVSGCPNFLIHGQPIARVGDKVHCPRCGDTTIATSSHSSVAAYGAAVAYDKDQTSCGAILYSRHNDLNGWGGNDASTTIEDKDPDSETILESKLSAAAPQNKFQEHFTLYDLLTGAAMPNIGYSIKNNEGEIFEGTTDAQGRTDVVWTESPKPIEIKIVRKEERDNYHIQSEKYEGL